MSVASTSINDGATSHHHLVVDPHDTPSNFPPESAHKKKKKKRKHDSLEDQEQPAGDQVNEIKRRKRLPDGEHEGVEETMQATLANSLEPDPLPKKKKGKKKDKGKAPSWQTQGDADTNAQATALLSAIVAAATAGPHDAQSVDAQGSFNVDLQTSQPSFDQYAPVQYGFSGPSSLQPADGQSFPAMGLPLPDMSFASNDDILRALQELDVSKIVNVLKTLGDAAVAANVPMYGAGFLAPPITEQPPPTPLGQVPMASNAILGIPPKPATHHRRTLDMHAAGSDQSTDPDHAYLLANKWLSTNKLAELTRTKGLVYKKGKFSAIEEQQLKNAMENFRHTNQLTEEQLHEAIFQKNDRGKDNAFWSELTAAVPQRPIIAVYHHVRRAYHPFQPKGPWTVEEDGLLKQAVTELGQRWEKVSERVGRRSADCRDRFRNHIYNRDLRVTGHWSKEEEERLTRIVTEMTINQGKDIDNDVFWGRVSEQMGGSRSRQQCRIKWTDSLSKTVKNEGQKPRWSQQDAFILVHKVDSLNVRDDTEIDWKTVSDQDWNLWSAHTLQRRWLTMKRSIKGFEDMTHQEIMDILRVKKAHLPASPIPSTRKRKERKKATSAAAVAECNDVNGMGEGESSVAGSAANTNNGGASSCSDDD